MIRQHVRRQFRGVVLALLVASFLAPGAWAQAEPTEIIETVPLTRETCTLTILSDDVLMCVGDEVAVEAELVCDPDHARVLDPQWYLGVEYLGSGDVIMISPDPGVYVLTATCASCEDQITVEVQDESECYRTPRLDAAFSNDATEATTGIFMQVNIAPVGQATFAYLKYLMRPFTLAAHESLGAGQFMLEAVGGNLDVYEIDGTLVSLPAFYDVSSLPVTVLVNATALGEGLVSATYLADRDRREVGRDEVAVRVGQFPGLAGGELSGFPFFEFVAAINDDEHVSGALSPTRHAERVGLSYRAYVVPHKTPGQWAADNTLMDASGGYETATVAPDAIADNTMELWSVGLAAGTGVGRPYDVVYDFGLDGQLDPGDLVDGLDHAEAGFYLVRDLNLAGSLETDMIQYTGGSWLGQRTYFPIDIGSMDPVPLIVISHGNGHQYTWYDYLGYHLASYGYIVMSHQNNTGPGIETASTTTLTNTDYILGHLDTIGGGILDGHLDSHRIVWIGHSRGGEGVVRAYDRVFDGTYVPAEYDLDDIILVSSIAPTVFLGTTSTNPHEVDYHLIQGAADGDVHGGASNPIAQALRIAEAARGRVQVTYVHGAGHNDFNCCGWNDATGPDLIGRAEAQRVAKSYYLALIEHYTRGNVPARDYLTRLYSDFHPSGIADHVICATTYRDALATDRFVIDDYQTNTELGVSSSGGLVTYDVANIHEDRLDDGNTSFTWTTTDPMNGMTRASGGDIYQGGVVFDWSPGGSLFYEFEVVPGSRDFRDHTYLAFRACQGTRHPETVALYAPLTFTVTLRDDQGSTSSVDFGVYGIITPPYQRTGQGVGAGWANEFNTVRIRLCDFENDGTGIDLADIVAVRLEVGAGFGSEQGRLGIDDVELTRD